MHDTMHEGSTDLVVCCSDGRPKALGLILKWRQENLPESHLYARPGGAGVLNIDRDTAIKEIATLVRLKQLQTIHLMIHIDCGAFGGSHAHADRDTELAFVRQHLDDAAGAVAAALPNLVVRSYVVDFDGVQPVEATLQTVAA